MKRWYTAVVFSVFFWIVTDVAAAQAPQPFYTRNLSPVVIGFGLPSAEGGALVAPGETSVRLVAETASHYTRKSAGDERVLFDGETSRVTATLRYGIADAWELGIDVPFVSHDGGELDGFIEGWHDFFGLPQGGRDSAPHDKLHYEYSRDTESSPALDVSGSGGGFGDLMMSGSYQLYRPADSGRALALRGGVKIPTGNSERLRGSGGTDVHLRLSAIDSDTLAQWNLTLFASAGILWLEQGDILKDQQRRWVGFGSAGLAWQPFSRIDVKLQLDGHSSFYRAGRLQQIDSESVQLGIGGTIHVSDRVRLDLAVVEDLIVGSAPDVVFHSALSVDF